MGRKNDKREEHRAWLAAHGDELARIGLPFRVFETAERWDDFLQNGLLDFHEDAGHFYFDQLSAEARFELHRFLERTDVRAPLRDWLRYRAAPELNDPNAAPAAPRDAILWLSSRGAHPWLVRHHELVLEAAQEIFAGLAALAIDVDRDHVLIGAALHDAGKIEHPSEMHTPGHAHEEAGERLLLASGVPPRIARACVTHAAWSEPRAELEDRLIALADKLWKGKRDATLEAALLAELTARTGRPTWEVFDVLDAVCERVADAGPERLARSAM